MTSTPSLPDLAASAVHALTGERWAIMDASLRVPRTPGLYAIYGDERAWSDLDLTPAPDQPLYVGKAEESLVSRDLNGHFATNPNSKARTGGSTVRRSFAALLRDVLSLRAVPRNLVKPERFANYALADGGDARLSEWMHARLTLAVWPAPTGMPVRLGDVETAVIVRFTPPINLDKNPGKLARLSRARADMATEASRWRPERPEGALRD
ncbi:GIY-YIG nuclease family protein [Microbacterium sp. R86528]|uniref:GIY-YIG nuclease family protein n=1 Tax=Microbacterium sp. R86528 TaxID=3093864 RepID=UPI0037C7C7B0